MMKGFEIKNVTDTSADLYVTGQIMDDMSKNMVKLFGDDDTAGFVFPVDVKNQLDQLKGKSLNVYINSPGGTVFAGVAIANMLKRHDGETTAIVDGVAASIATQIFFACDNKQMPKNAYLMIHKPMMSTAGNADELLQAADTLDTIQKGMESLYVSNAQKGITADQIHEMVNKTTWLTGEDAAQIFNIKTTDALQMVACVGKLPENIGNIPENIKFVAENMPKKPVKQPENNDKSIEKLAEYKLKRQKNDIAVALAMAQIL
ncbi:head maturation protease, ClpP-related [Pectinatus haikarae]|uniref:ATP-dependent Clp protease proteolytic subunit n=1 Tax=Pectinatus haikarae TaxID=349096 RepID=A0ABT9Y9A6_9FIRM|nr:head maturation protease, ClpP-related [Pectinatus haikarae]MDQ0204075.1 ATP-dependent protease ClpP protease subunit [Pectinatus haikarae]